MAGIAFLDVSGFGQKLERLTFAKQSVQENYMFVLLLLILSLNYIDVQLDRSIHFDWSRI